MELSIIVPALDEERMLEETLRRAAAGTGVELIVVDGGSSDATVALARAQKARVLASERGRALQMNAGAAAASGEALLFLHADTLLPSDFAAAIAAALSDPGVVGGRFDVDLVPSSPLLRLVAALMNLRSRWSRIATGDQAIFVRRRVFERMGGFTVMPLMEDIDFSRRLKRNGRIACLRQRVETSSRRWRERGPLRTIFLMWRLRFLYWAGFAPERLRRSYVDQR